jgi:hypothetical protein
MYRVVIQVVFVSVMTGLTDLIKPTYYSSCVCVSMGSSPVKSKILTNCPIQAPYNHEDSPEKRDVR